MVDALELDVKHFLNNTGTTIFNEIYFAATQGGVCIDARVRETAANIRRSLKNSPKIGRRIAGFVAHTGTGADRLAISGVKVIDITDAGSIAQTGIELMVEKKHGAGANFRRKSLRFMAVTL